MRIDSKLMKMDFELEAIERQEDRILMKSPPDDWNNTKVYLSPQDVITVLRLASNRGMIAYVLLFPFFFVADYLRREKEVNENVNNIGYIIAAVFMGLLFLGGITYLLAEPLGAALILSILAGLFFLITVLSRKPGFLYLAIPLSVIAYFLLGFGRGIELRSFPLLAMGVVLTLLILGKALGGELQGKLTQPLYFFGYLLELIFVIYILFFTRNYAYETPWLASIPLLAFSLFHFVRYLDTKDVLHHYLAAPLLGFGFVLLLYGIPILPFAYYGLALIVMSMAMILIADRYHESHGLEHVSPTYIVAILLSLIAFTFAWYDQTVLLLSLTLFSVHFFGGTYSLGIKSTKEDWANKTFQWTEFALANLAAGVAAILMLTISRTSWVSIFVAGIYVYDFLKMGFRQEPTILETRNQYLWAAGGFYTLLVFVLLGFFDPFGNPQTDMLLVPPLLLPLLIYGRIVHKKGLVGPAASIFESSLLTVLVALFLPIVLGGYQFMMAGIVAGVLFTLYVVLGLLWREEILFYALPFLVANLFYNGLVEGGVKGVSIGLAYIPLGLLAMIIALFFRKRNAGVSHIFFIAWFVFSSASMIVVNANHSLIVYIIAGWSSIYFLVASAISQNTPTQETVEVVNNV